MWAPCNRLLQSAGSYSLSASGVSIMHPNILQLIFMMIFCLLHSRFPSFQCLGLGQVSYQIHPKYYETMAEEDSNKFFAGF